MSRKKRLVNMKIVKSLKTENDELKTRLAKSKRSSPPQSGGAK